MTVSPMPTLYRPSAHEFRKFVDRRVPVLIKGAISDWRAPETWTLDRLEALLGNVEVRVQSRFGPRALDFEYRDVPFKTVTESVRRDGTDYLISAPLLDRAPALWADVSVPPYVGRLALPPIVWVGPKGSFTPLHFDIHHGLLAQIKGRKKVSVLQFRRRDVVLRAELREPARFSESPDADTSHATGLVPRRRWECTLEPRDLLFLPSRRHHSVQCLDATISLGFSWHTAPMRVVRRLFGLVARMQGP